ncbi:MAG: hypothetical protein AB8G05_24100 [Oligoflexales bacterium]
MKKFIIVLTFLKFTPLLAKDTEVYSYKGKLVIDRPYTVYQDSSEYLREGKDFYISSGLGLIAYWMSMGAYINPDLLIHINYVEQNDTVTGSSSMIGFGLTRFVDNSLYLTMLTSYREGDTIDYKNSIIDDKKILYSTDYGLDFAIGNRWNWHNFFIGADWFAIYFPVIGKQVKNFEMQFRILMLHVGLAW